MNTDFQNQLIARLKDVEAIVGRMHTAYSAVHGRLEDLRTSARDFPERRADAVIARHEEIIRDIHRLLAEGLAAAHEAVERSREP